MSEINAHDIREKVLKEILKYGVSGIILAVFLYNYHLDQKMNREYTQKMLTDSYNKNAAALDKFAAIIEAQTRALERMEKRSIEHDISIAIRNNEYEKMRATLEKMGLTLNKPPAKIHK